MEEGRRSANRNELLSRDGMNFAQQMALGAHLPFGEAKDMLN
jgi:hypothetical protein